MKQKTADLHGKTISKINAGSVNCWIIHFTDGTKVTLETEHVGYGLYGIIRQ